MHYSDAVTQRRSLQGDAYEVRSARTMPSITTGGCQQYHLLCGRGYGCLRISAALVSTISHGFKTPGVICTTFPGSAIIKRCRLRWPHGRRYEVSRAPNHLKKWNSGVGLEQDVWQIAVPCKHQDNGRTESHTTCGPSAVGGLFNEASANWRNTRVRRGSCRGWR